MRVCVCMFAQAAARSIARTYSIRQVDDDDEGTTIHYYIMCVCFCASSSVAVAAAQLYADSEISLNEICLRQRSGIIRMETYDCECAPRARRVVLHVCVCGA